LKGRHDGSGQRGDSGIHGEEVAMAQQGGVVLVPLATS